MMNGSGLDNAGRRRPLDGAVIARAWRDPTFMASLSEDQLASLPDSPAGSFDGRHEEDRGLERHAGTVAATCSTVAATCSTPRNKRANLL